MYGKENKRLKKIVYTQRVEVIEGYHERRDCADQRIPAFISKCGYLPLPLPNIKEIAHSIVSTLNPDGIVLTGGNSLQGFPGNAPERDEVDSYLISYAIQNNIPVYGFCRGMQSIMSYFGCKVVDICGHVAVRHTVVGDLRSVEVNSYHNQACVELSAESGLYILGRTKDGVIEEIKHNEYKIFGTMWHPEREIVFSESDIYRVKNIFN